MESPCSPDPLPPILQLPQEILEEVLASLDQRTDLLSLALSCQALAAQIIPHHTDYRVIRVRTLNPTIFAHLARREDLARNVHEVHIAERHNYTTVDRLPKTLVDADLDCDPLLNGTYDEVVKTRNVCKALHHMRNLRVFTWSCNSGAATMKNPGETSGMPGPLARDRPAGEPSHEEAILSVVVRKPTLEHFGISGAFATHVEGLPLDKSFTYPVWHLNNLKSLCLLGNSWLSNANALPICIMLSRSPNLEYLEIPLEFKHLHTLHFPSLKRVKLHLLSGATTLVDNSSARFVENNPTIEELSWYPIGIPNLRPGSLPNLKHLKTNLQVIRGLARESEGPGHPGSIMATTQPANLLSAPTTKRTKRLSKIQEESEPNSDGSDNEEGYTYAREQPPSCSFASPPSSPLISAPPSTPIVTLSPPQPNPIFTRRIESLDVSGLSASELLELPFLQRSALKRLSLSHITDVETVWDVAEEFPNIEWLMLPVRHSPSSEPASSGSSSSSNSRPLDVDTILSLLPHFQKLRVFRGRALWHAIGGGKSGEKEKAKMHEVLGELVQLCPMLEEVDHCDFYEKRWGFRRVVIDRKLVSGEGCEADPVEVIGYDVRRPYMRGCFDVLDGAFA